MLSETDKSAFSPDKALEYLSEMLSQKATLLQQLFLTVQHLKASSTAETHKCTELEGIDLPAFIVSLQSAIRWMEDSAEFELHRIVQITCHPQTVLDSLNMRQLLRHLQSAFSTICDNSPARAQTAEGQEIAVCLNQLPAELHDRETQVSSGHMPDEADDLQAELETELLAESACADGLFAEEEIVEHADAASFDDELLTMLQDEAEEHFAQCRTSLAALEASVQGNDRIDDRHSQALDTIHHSVHTIGGASSVLGMHDLSALCSRIETFLNWLGTNNHHRDPAALEVLGNLLDLLQGKICTPGKSSDQHEKTLLEGLDWLMHASPTTAEPLESADPGASSLEEAEPSTDACRLAPEASDDLNQPQRSDTGTAGQSRFSDEEQQMLLEGFQEESEGHLHDMHSSLQHLTQTIAAPQPMTSGIQEEFRKIRRAVHTIKGASAVLGLQGIATYAHKLEDYLDWLYEEATQVDPSSIAALLEAYDLLSMLTENPAAVSLERQDRSHQRLMALTVNPAPAQPPEMTDVATPLPEEPVEVQELTFPTTAGISSTQFDEEELQMLFEGFKEEAEEHLQQLHQSLQLLENEVQTTETISPGHREELRKIRRAVHTIKGASSVIGMTDIAAYAHKVEDFLDWLYEQALQIAPPVIAGLAESCDLLALFIEEPITVSAEQQQAIHNRLQRLISGDLGDNHPVLIEPAQGAAQTSPADDHLADAEMAEPTVLSMTQTSARTIRIKQQQFDDLLNLANELLVGVSGFDRNMTLFKSTIEELQLTTNRLKSIALELETKFEVKALDQLSQHFSHLDRSLDEMKHQENFAEFDALELDRYTQLNLIIRSLNESTVDVSAIYSNLGGIHSGISGNINRQYRTIRDLQIRMMRTRMSPLSILAPRLNRTVREVASHLGKQVRFVLSGEMVELDRLAWEKLADPFMHLVRNAIHHGLEDTDTRLALNKPEFGTLTLSGQRQGNHIVLRLSDDGQGLDFEAIRKKAKALGLPGDIDRMNTHQLTNIIFTPGFSTKSVSEISGRGIGMDVVKENVQELQGTVTVETAQGKGTTFVLRIPLTLGVVRALMFRIGKVTYGIALNDIKDIRRADSTTLFRNEGKYQNGDEMLDYYPVQNLLGYTEEQPEEQPLILIMNTWAYKNIALSIPPITGQKEIVIKSVGSHLKAIPGITGVAVLGDGNVVPVLNIACLIDTAEQSAALPESPVSSPKAPETLTVMVVDDSISIRRVMSRLVASNGWIPVEAKDGLDALELLESGAVAPHCILLDIEMPRLNGFELLAKLSNLAGAEHIPVIMLTSRTSEKHREKALQLGAKAFLNKPCKDEHLVDTILNLTGRIAFPSPESVEENIL